MIKNILSYLADYKHNFCVFFSCSYLFVFSEEPLVILLIFIESYRYLWDLASFILIRNVFPFTGMQTYQWQNKKS